MWGAILTNCMDLPWARRVAGSLVAITVVLFILNLRRTAERAGRAAKQLEILEHNDAVYRQILAAAASRPRSRDHLLDRLRGGGF